MEAQQIADKTRERITKRGFCLWKCQTLNGEVIAIVKNRGFRPAKFKGVVYNERELEILCESENIGLIHVAKKEGFEIQDTEQG